MRELCPNKHFETIFTLCSLQLVRFLKRSHSKLLNSAILISAIFLDTTHKNSGLFLQRHFSKICTNWGRTNRGHPVVRWQRSIFIDNAKNVTHIKCNWYYAKEDLTTAQANTWVDDLASLRCFWSDHLG